MFEINKQQFGNFIAELRKMKGITQKELAEKLYVSDKAVSKWECGLSMPDITLLKPLSELLGVTVTELLESRHMDSTEQINIEKMDRLIDKAVWFSEEEIQEQRIRKKKRGIIFIVCTLVCCVEIMISLLLGFDVKQILLPNLTSLILGFVFGIWFCFLAKEKIPSYYDEHRISAYSDGFFQMNMPGIRFNNRNWKHILRVGIIWSMTIMVASPLIGIVLNLLFNELAAMILSFSLVLTLTLAGFFIPIYVVAKKYE